MKWNVYIHIEYGEWESGRVINHWLFKAMFGVFPCGGDAIYYQQCLVDFPSMKKRDIIEHVGTFCHWVTSGGVAIYDQQCLVEFPSMQKWEIIEHVGSLVSVLPLMCLYVLFPRLKSRMKVIWNFFSSVPYLQ